MSSLANSPSVPPSQSPHYANQANDEIDLKQLFTLLWEGKLLIIISTLIFTLAAIGYALTSQELWSAKAIVSKPQLQDIASYQQAVKRYQPLFNVYQDDGTIIVSHALDNLFDPKMIFQQFVQTFNANGVKRRFMQTSPTFLASQKQVLGQTNDPNVVQKLHEVWLERISATVADKNSNDIFTLSFQALDRASSLTLLNEYIQFVNQALNQQLNANFISTLAAKYGELSQQEKSLLQQAQLRLQVELERTQYALTIADAADIKQPVPNLGEQDIFAINIGSRALKAKVDALKSIKDLSVFEPRLATLQGRLKEFDLDALILDAKWSVNGFYYLDQPELPLERTNPKRTLIVVLGGLFGGVLGIGIVLVRYALRRQ